MTAPVDCPTHPLYHGMVILVVIDVVVVVDNAVPVAMKVVVDHAVSMAIVVVVDHLLTHASQ